MCDFNEKHTLIPKTDFNHDIKNKDIYPCNYCDYCIEPQDKLIYNIYYFHIGKVKQILDKLSKTDLYNYKIYDNKNIMEHLIHKLSEVSELKEGEIVNINHLYITDLDNEKGKRLLKIISFINEKCPNLLIIKNSGHTKLLYLLQLCCNSVKLKEMLNIDINSLKNEYFYNGELSLFHPEITYFKKVYKRHTNFMNY